MSRSVVIVGGGLAGLSAAVALAERDFRVTLLDSRPRLGGRASSFVDQSTGELIDNCQHVSMGCCTNFDWFCRTVGIDEFFQTEEQLEFIEPPDLTSGSETMTPPRSFPLHNGPLPAPLHLANALRKHHYLSFSDQLRIATTLRTLARLQSRPSVSFAQWLVEKGQNAVAMDRFWDVVLVSALSETLDRIDVWSARKVFIDGFMANRDGWKVKVPTVPLDQLYGSVLSEWLDSHRVDWRLKTQVAQIDVTDKVQSARLRNGEDIQGSDFILAVPFHRLRELVPDGVIKDDWLRNVDQFESAPIASAHLWFDRPFTEKRHAVLIGRFSQWMFHRSAISRTESKGAYYQVVISAAREASKLRQQEVIERVLADIHEVWPESRSCELIHSRVVTEHRAVFSVVPGIDALRPQQQTSIQNLQLAGDWTQTGWPATMEGAVRSGLLAAENVLRNHGESESLLQPDLPTALLSKLVIARTV
ncbi:MAG: hypothetical protein CMJ78_19810 [Planctomycetaceae bacterium]|nr:hypothetical protein [Planctomycetaceae bacterium]